MLNEMINPYGLNCVKGPKPCPVCGRYHYRPLEGYWCPYCGTGLTKEMREQLRSLSDRIAILEQLLEWSKIHELEELEGLDGDEENNG